MNKRTVFYFTVLIYSIFMLSESQAMKRSRENHTLETEEHISKLLKDSQPSLTLEQAARFFMAQQKTETSTDLSASRLGKTKLQKLCYYAQGYQLALKNSPLFSEDFVAYTHGPYNINLNASYGLITPYNTTSQSSELIVEEESTAHLQTIFEMKKNYTAKKLTADTHKEKPWSKTVASKGKSLNSIIERPLMYKYFSQDDKIYEYLITRLFSLKTFTEQILGNTLKDLVNYMYNISTKEKFIILLPQIDDFIQKFKPTANSSIPSSLNNLTPHLNKSIKSDELLPFFIEKWSSQTTYEAVSAFIFYPSELRENTDTLSSLYRREYIHNLLAYSAKYGNPLAFYHLAQICQNYDSGQEDSTLNNLYKIFTKKADEKISEELLTKSDHQIPQSSVGLYYYFNNQRTEAIQLFQKGYDQKDPVSTYYLAMMSEERQTQYKIYDEAFKLGYKPALLGLARSAETIDQTYDNYLKAGQQGIAEGYWQAANMLKQGTYSNKVSQNNLKQALEYTEKAGELGMATAYQLGKSIVLKNNNIEQAKEFCRKWGNKGDALGYYELAELLITEEKIQEAIIYFRKSGKLLGSVNAAKLQGDHMQVEKENDKFLSHFTSLRDIIEDSNDD